MIEAKPTFKRALRGYHPAIEIGEKVYSKSIEYFTLDSAIEYAQEWAKAYNDSKARFEAEMKSLGITV